MRSSLSLSAALLLVGCDGSNDAGEDPPLPALDCEVAIVGGGAAGVYTAYRLAPELGERVCLFEKEAHLGGRMHDVTFDGGEDGPRVGTGARRIMENQLDMFALADELGVELETPPLGSDLINARGLYGFSRDALLPAYPALQGPLDADDATDRETELYDVLRLGPERERAGNYPDYRAYVREVLGDEEYNFLRDMSRFRADFEYPLSPTNYLAMLDEEWDTCCVPSYPVGGMSAFTDAMAERIAAAGGRIYRSEPAVDITRDGGGYRIRTSAHDVTAAELVLAVPPVGLDKITGAVADDIRERPEYQGLIPVRVAIVNQWWDEAWWQDVRDPESTADEPHTWRAWTSEHCINFIEIPFEPYAAAQKTTRSIYTDDLHCIQFWEELLANDGIAAVEAEILRGLDALFNNGVSSPAMVGIPRPRKTEMYVWPGGWYYTRAGADASNQDVAAWAVTPVPGESTLSLVGEAYWPQRPGWSIGAYRSADAVLADKFGVEPQFRSAALAPRERRARGFSQR
ncbi:MAG: FAD-dependent oxidoreductase [Myxococcales bacterium]|nr:FAD-dependent oxidoreductase [Myxococcales bacterium]